MHRFIFRHHKIILICALLLSLASVFSAFRLNLDLSLFSLLPDGKPEVRLFFRVTEKIGFQSLLVSIVEIQGDAAPERIEPLVEELARRYRQSSLIEAVDFKNDHRLMIAEAFDVLLPYAPLLLSTEGFAKLADRLTDAHIQRRIAENRRLLMTPFAGAGKDMIRQDPLGIGELLYEDLSLPGFDRQRTLPGGFHRSRDRRTYFLFLKPSKPPQDIAFSKKLMLELESIERGLLAEKTESFGGRPPQISIQHTGGHPIAVHDEAVTKFDIKITLLTSLAGVLLLFYFAFRALKLLLFISLPLVMSLLWTVGFAGLAFQRLNILTCIFSCVLIGLGVDFAIHIVNRYCDSGAEALAPETRLETTFRESGTGILMGGLTTAAAFYAVGLSDFKGFRELGFMAGTGILFCILAMMLVLPSLLVRSSLKGGRAARATISGFGLQRPMSLLTKHPWRTLMLVIPIIGFLIYQGARIRFDDNLKNFRPRDHAALNLQQKVTQWLGGSIGPVLLIVTAPSETAAMTLNALATQALESLRRSGDIAAFSSVSQLIPSPAHQQKNAAAMAADPELFSIQRVRETFEAALAAGGFRPSEAYDRYLDRLGAAFSNQNVLLPSRVEAPNLKRILSRYFFADEEGFSAVTYIHPPGDLWSYDETNRFRDLIVARLNQNGMDASHYRLTGANLLTGELKQLIVRNLEESMGIAVVSILSLLFVYFRSLRHLLLSVTPLAVGMAALLGIMVLLGLDFNFLNIMVLPMIIGIGIDDGIHFTNTFRRARPGGLQQGLFQTGRAVMLTSLTTVAGFGSIALSHYPGLKSMGYAAVIGIAACLLASILVLPPLLTLLVKER